MAHGVEVKLIDHPDKGWKNSPPPPPTPTPIPISLQTSTHLAVHVARATSAVDGTPSLVAGFQKSDIPFPRGEIAVRSRFVSPGYLGCVPLFCFVLWSQ